MKELNVEEVVTFSTYEILELNNMNKIMRQIIIMLIMGTTRFVIYRVMCRYMFCDFISYRFDRYIFCWGWAGI
jgi:hypothetical protein